MGPRPGRALVIAIAGSLLGLAWNRFSGHGFALGSNVYVQPGDELVEAPAAKARLERGALFLDARESAFYEMGHVPGALNLPEEDFDAAFARLEPLLRERFDVIVYCSGFGCEASHIVARKLRARGVPAAVLNEGWPAWTDAGYPVKAGAPP
jgi:rhodanese-related sulfurtransferase